MNWSIWTHFHFPILTATYVCKLNLGIRQNLVHQGTHIMYRLALAVM